MKPDAVVQRGNKQLLFDGVTTREFIGGNAQFFLAGHIGHCHNGQDYEYSFHGGSGFGLKIVTMN